MDITETRVRQRLHDKIIRDKVISIQAMAGELRRLTPGSKASAETLESYIYNAISPDPPESNKSHPSLRLLIAYRNLTGDVVPAQIFLKPIHATVVALPTNDPTGTGMLEVGADAVIKASKVLEKIKESLHLASEGGKRITPGEMQDVQGLAMEAQSILSSIWSADTPDFSPGLRAVK